MPGVNRPVLGRALALAILVAVAGGCATPTQPAGTTAATSSSGSAAQPTVPSAAASGPIVRIGAVFPIGGNAAALADQELAGVRIAAQLANDDRALGDRRIELDVRDLEAAGDAPAAMAAFKAEGVKVVIGAYSSDLSIPASAAANAEGLVYWEAGAVADQLTGRGLPLVFRVGASGRNLGTGSGTFATSDLAPRLGRTASSLRVAIVAADDAYAQSVADAARASVTAAGSSIVTDATYNLSAPDWPTVMASLASGRPDVIILASHIADGVAFRRAMLAANLKVGALIGSTMAECDPDFAGDLGADAIGIFASDRPTAGFQPSALDTDARATYDRFLAAWQSSGTDPLPSAQAGDGSNGYGSSGYGSAEYTIHGPAEDPSAEAAEEALAGFSAGWALFHDVLPQMPATGPLEPNTVAAAARSLDLPTGSLPNGAGLKFSDSAADLGQNVRAASVIWQWQAVRTYAFVWPASYSTGQVGFVPLPR